MNPFDSRTRLQAIIDKCKGQRYRVLTWCVQAIWRVCRLKLVTSLSGADTEVIAATDNRGFID
eukprot:745474-Prorocentrum_lima.AAC.1